MTVRRRLLIGSLVAVAALLIVGRLLSHVTAELLWAASLGPTDLGAIPMLPLASQLAWTVPTTCWFLLHLGFAAHIIAKVVHEDRLPLAVLAADSSHTARWTVAGIVALPFGILLTTGAAEWWTMVALALHGVETGVTEAVYGRDAGYYLAVVPWFEHLQNFLLGVCTITVVLLVFGYGAAGALRVRDRRLLIDRAPRRHLAGLLATVALVLAWRWTTSAEAGLAGFGSGFPELSQGGAALPILAVLAAGASLAWIWWPQEIIPGSAWATLATGWVVILAAMPFQSQRRAGPVPPELYAVAFGDTLRAPRPLELGAGDPDSVGALANRVTGIPTWDADRIIARYNAGRSSGALHGVFDASYHAAASATDTRPEGRWRGILEPDPARHGRATSPRDEALRALTWGVLEFDPGRGVGTAEHPDARFLFAPRAGGHVLASDGEIGIALGGPARRVALAWALQEPALFGQQGRLIWRRTPSERLREALPVADFRDPYLVQVRARWTWVLDGYVTARSFPEVTPRQLDQNGDPLRYVRSGLIGTVDPESGAVRIYLSRGADPLAKAWASILSPVIQPSDSMPDDLRDALRYPPTLFRMQIQPIADRLAEGTERLRVVGTPASLRRPHWSVARLGQDPSERLWISAALMAGLPSSYRGILAGTIVDGKPLLVYQRVRGTTPVSPAPRPGQDSLGGSEHAWPVGGALFRQQTVYVDVASGVPEIAQVRTWWGEWASTGRTREEALAALFYLGPRSQTVPDIWGRWVRAQDIIRQADSLFTSGDLSGFENAFDELKRLLAPGQAPR